MINIARLDMNQQHQQSTHSIPFELKRRWKNWENIGLHYIQTYYLPSYTTHPANHCLHNHHHSQKWCSQWNTLITCVCSFSVRYREEHEANGIHRQAYIPELHFLFNSPTTHVAWVAKKRIKKTWGFPKPSLPLLQWDFSPKKSCSSQKSIIF